MKQLRFINTLLILAGVGLIAVIIVVARQPNQVAAVQSDTADVVLRRATHQRQPAAVPALPEIILPEGFSWDSIESRDYKQYIANLRAIECPEATIRDIIVADINKLYEPREAPLRVQNLYAAGGPSNKYGDLNDLQRMRQLREVQLEKRTLLKELLGIVIPLDPMRTVNPRRYGDFEAAFAAVPADKRAQVQTIQENYWYQSDYLNVQVAGPHDPKAAEDQKRLINEERRRELAKVLTPAEMEDYELRTSHAASYMRAQLRDFTPSEQEFREIFRIKAEYDIHFGGKYNAHNGPVEELNPGIRPEIEQRVQQVLGEQRYQEYQRTRDPNYRALSQVATRYDLPPGTANAAYDIDQRYRDAKARLSSDPALTAEQRKLELANTKSQTDQALTQVLGDRGSKAFQRMRK
jgi:hypothetical protein